MIIAIVIHPISKIIVFFRFVSLEFLNDAQEKIK